MASFAQATAIQALNSHTYLAHFPEAWCIGSVPHGGFVTSCFLSATALHFSTTHATANQPHTIALHLTFLRRTSIGPARFLIRDVKLGRRTSTIHVSLTQGEEDNAEPSVVGYLTQSNLRTEEGISLQTRWALHPPPPPLASITKQALRAGKDDNWTLMKPLHPNFRKASQRAKIYVPRNGQLEPGMADEWICLKDGGEKFTQESLGFVVDQFPQIVEIYPGTDPPASSNKTVSKSATSKANENPKPNWYPTMLLNLDVKKALPEEGVDWLFVRVRAKKIENGRMDLEVVVLDEGADLVAVSNHVCLILSSDRNMTRNGKGGVGREGGTKL